MKNKNFKNEKNLLPLTFKYMEIIKIDKQKSDSSNVVYYLRCDKYQTDFHTRQKPFKNIVRLI